MTTLTNHGPGQRRLLDIEDALTWAYRDELPKSEQRGGDGLAGGTELIEADGFGTPLRLIAAGSVGPVWRMGKLGTQVDNWSREPGFPAAMGDSHPDAVVIGAHVSRLARYENHTFEHDPGLMDGMDEMPIDPAAAVRRATASITGLVIASAKLRTRPVWSPLPTPHPTPSYGDHGLPKVLALETRMRIDSFGSIVVEDHVVACTATRKETYPQRRDGRWRIDRDDADGVVIVDASGATVYRETGDEEGRQSARDMVALANAYPGVRSLPIKAYCPVRWDPSPALVLLERAEYAVWRTALDILAQELSGLLASITVIAPSAPLCPWAGDRELGKPVPVFTALRTEPHRLENRKVAAERRKAGARREVVDAGRRVQDAPARPSARRERPKGEVA